MVILTLIIIVSFFSLRASFLLADCILYPLVYHVFKYRRTVVRKNLTECFPEMTADEIIRLEKKFYHRFTSLFVEIIYGLHISDREMRRRFVFRNLDRAEELAHEKGGVIYMLGHFGNWEWIADVAKRYEDPRVIHYNVYRRQKSEPIDRLMLRVRNKRSGVCVEKNSLLRQMVSTRNNGIPKTYGLICDQHPSPHNEFLHTEFLHHDTAFLGGGEQLSKKLGYAAMYVHIHSPKRGYYEADIIELKGDNITEQYARLLEENIKEQPELWLWTHNRWKYRKSADQQKKLKGYSKNSPLNN